jgi:hypothetical protein
MAHTTAQLQAQINSTDRLLRALEVLMRHKPLSEDVRRALSVERQRLIDVVSIYIEQYNVEVLK